jgi:hypothetical protein
MNNVHLFVRLGLWAIHGIAAVPLAIITGEFSVLNWLIQFLVPYSSKHYIRKQEKISLISHNDHPSIIQDKKWFMPFWVREEIQCQEWTF